MDHAGGGLRPPVLAGMLHHCRAGVKRRPAGAWVKDWREALKDLGRKYDVDAVILGTLDVSNIRPRVDLLSIVTSLSVSAEVDAVMTARLLDTRDGTVLWTDSARDRKTVGQVSVWRGGGIFFDARDPEQAYGSLIRSLVARTTRDFQWR